MPSHANKFKAASHIHQNSSFLIKFKRGKIKHGKEKARGQREKREWGDGRRSSHDNVRAITLTYTNQNNQEKHKENEQQDSAFLHSCPPPLSPSLSPSLALSSVFFLLFSIELAETHKRMAGREAQRFSCASINLNTAETWWLGKGKEEMQRRKRNGREREKKRSA